MRAESARRQVWVEQGDNRDSAWFPLLDHEWPVAGEAIHRWLDADNFDRAGRQKQRLRDIQRAIRKMIVVSSRCMLEVICIALISFSHMIMATSRWIGCPRLLS